MKEVMTNQIGELEERIVSYFYIYLYKSCFYHWEYLIHIDGD